MATKWYKKQMKELLGNSKPDAQVPAKSVGPLKKNNHSFGPGKPAFKSGFVSPVVQRNINRPKTDSK